ncbi:MAG TPA: arginine repressor, partial [Candidatus Dormibacteraeota bacterium]|nr:arginine repressor [Candidatus Dormibacteraeota bacterium]
SRLHRVIAELVLSVEGSANLIVLKTPPGSAMMVASALDDARWPELMGTIGGDDTILVIVRDAAATSMLVQRFLDLRGESAA